MKFALTSCVALLSAFVAAAGAGVVHHFPEDGWAGAKVGRDKRGALCVLDGAGKTLLRFDVTPRAVEPELKVSVEGDGVVVDTRAAKRAAKGADVVVVAHGPRFDAPELQGEECRYRLALSSSDNNARVRAYVIGARYDEKGKRHWMAFSPYGGPYVRVSKETRAEYDVPFDGTVMPLNSTNYTWRFDFRGANSPVKFYGARLARYTDMPIERPARRKVDPKLLFHASFDGDSPVADFAAGEKTPKTARGLAYAPGRNGGRAVRMSSAARSALSYPAAGNLLRGRGTVALWYRNESDARAELGPFLFSSGCPFYKRIGTGFPYLWYWRDTLRFDSSADSDSYVMCGVGVADGHWHHVVAAWNEYGRTYWVDGVPAPADDSVIARALASNDLYSYSRDRPLELFAVGGQIDGSSVLDCVVDDVRIYSDALDGEQARGLWEKDGGVSPPPPDYASVLPSENRYEGGFAAAAGRIDPSDLELLQDIARNWVLNL